MDAPIFTKLNHWNGLIFTDAFGLISFTNRENGITDHLRAERRGFSHFVIDQVMQRDPIPASLLDGTRNNLITDQEVSILKVQKTQLLCRSGLKKDTDGPFHCAKIIVKGYFILKHLRRAALPPTPKGAGIRAVI
jgi:hypothetical protein